MKRTSNLVDESGTPLVVDVPKPARIRAQEGWDVLRRRYESDQWELATRGSANSLETRERRQQLRDLCRYEVRNNPHLAGLLAKITNEVIGTGPRLSIEFPGHNPGIRQLQAAERLEKLWDDFTIESNFVEKLRLMAYERPVSGEVFSTVFPNRNLETVPVDFTVYEAEQFQDPDQEFTAQIDGYHVDGIRFDRYGNPTSYCRLDYYPYSDTYREWDTPGRYQTAAFQEHSWLPSDIVFHWFRKQRPSQYRGVPDVAATLEVYSRLRRFIESKVKQEELRAKLLGVVKTGFPPEQCFDMGDEPWDMLIGDGQFMSTPDGWDATAFRFDATGQGVMEFIRASLMWATQALMAPWNIVSGDSSDYNFASGRLDFQQFYRYVDVVQSYLERHFLCWFFERHWWPVAQNMGNYGLSDFKCIWYWPEREPIDKLKDAQAMKVQDEIGMLDKVEEYRKRGENALESMQRQVNFELVTEMYRQQRASELGIKLTQPNDTEEQDNVD